ncbi:MAG: hypothetical protein QOH58_569 [Thermoleophilaceae bacterium]|jgi:quinol monooxygenase YgiN|nr:hypothetical protein [Thermoleophilaceae bacterium]
MPDGVHAVTKLRCDPADAERLEALMVEDYEHLATNSAFIEGRLIASVGEPGTYFHVTHWSSAEALAEAAQDPVVKRIFGGLPLAAQPEGHRGSVVVSVAGGTVTRPVV